MKRINCVESCSKTPKAVGLSSSAQGRKRQRNGMKDGAVLRDSIPTMTSPPETTSTSSKPNITIRKYSNRRDMLWRLSLIFGVFAIQATAALDSEADEHLHHVDLERRRLESDEKIRERFLQQEQQQQHRSNSACVDVIVTFVGARGNTDTSFGNSDFKRTNCKIMPCISPQVYDGLLQSSEVLAVELDEPVNPAQTTWENGEAIPWGVDLAMQSSWNEIPGVIQSSPPMSICVVDSGLLVAHQDIPYTLNGPNIKGKSFDLPEQTQWFNPSFYAYHGSHVAGTMLAEGFNGEGIRGIIPNNANVNLLIARVFGDESMAMAKTSTIEKAMEWCADQGARVINLSLAGTSQSLNSQRLIDRFVMEENIILVGASGNAGVQNPTEPSYPASYENVISVGSIGSDLTRSPFSQYGEFLDLVAPGDETYSTVPSFAFYDDQQTEFDAGPMAFTPIPNSLITGHLFDCGQGDVLCTGATGKVCLMEFAFPDLGFKPMAINCQAAGGVGLVVYPATLSESLDSAYMDAMEGEISISVVTVSRENGLRLLAKRGKTANISFNTPSYRNASGTSMSAAHVSAVIARIWGARPQCSNAQVRAAIEETALDLGAPGRDDVYGHGLVQAISAYHYLLDQPAPCGVDGGSGGFEPENEPVAETTLIENPERPVSQMKAPTTEHKKDLMICKKHPFCPGSPGAARRLRHGLRGQAEHEAEQALSK